MQVQVSTNNHVDGDQNLIGNVQAEVITALERFTDRITRVEVYLSDVNSGDKSGVDKRCVMEARLSGMKPMAVNHEAENLYDAVGGALDKLKKLVDRTIDRTTEAKGRTSFSGDQVFGEPRLENRD